MSDTSTHPQTDTATVRNTIGVSLMGSEESNVIIEYVRDTMPDATVADKDCYYKIEREGLLNFDMADITERLGRPYSEHDFLVSMTTYYGRIVVNEGVVQFHADILPERFRD